MRHACICNTLTLHRRLMALKQLTTVLATGLLLNAWAAAAPSDKMTATFVSNARACDFDYRDCLTGNQNASDWMISCYRGATGVGSCQSLCGTEKPFGKVCGGYCAGKCHSCGLVKWANFNMHFSTWKIWQPVCSKRVSMIRFNKVKSSMWIAALFSALYSYRKLKHSATALQL